MYVLRKRFNLQEAEALSSKPFKHAVTVMESARIAEILDDSVIIIDSGLNRRTVPCDHIVTCWTRPNTGFLQEAGKAKLPVINVGDSVQPRNLHAAVREGATAGLYAESYNFINPNKALINEVEIDIAAQLSR